MKMSSDLCKEFLKIIKKIVIGVTKKNIDLYIF